MFDLTGKTALVTGASGGIGAEIAKALHAQGATVGLTGTRVEALEKVAAEIGGERVHILPCNLSDDDALAGLPKQAEAAMGGIDILVNNAGLTRDMLAMRLKDEDWDAVINVNLSAAFKLSKAVLRGMMKKRAGRIINVGSVVGTMGNAGQTNYAAAKAGVIGFTKSMAREVASRGVTVNTVAPGFIETDMTKALNDDQRAATLSNVPAGRLGDPREIASAVVFLASPEAAYITGETLHVNGGMYMV